MDEPSNMVFPLVDEYMGIHMKVDFRSLRPGRVKVVASSRRFRKELSYGFVHGLWWVWLRDGRSAASVPPGARKAVEEILSDVRRSEQLFDPNLAEQLQVPVNEALRKAGLKAADRVIYSLGFACNASLLRRHPYGDCRRLVDEIVPPAEGLRLPKHCFPDGIVYGVVADGMVVSVAFVHGTGIMEDQIADLGVETAPAYRRRGYAKTVVSAVVEHITRTGGEACYGCSPENDASSATARSVGFIPYRTSLILSAPRPDLR